MKLKTYRYSIYDHTTDTKIAINTKYLQKLIALYVHDMLEEGE